MQGKGVLGQEGQQEPGRCAGEVQGVGGQSWGQQSTSPCWKRVMIKQNAERMFALFNMF